MQSYKKKKNYKSTAYFTVVPIFRKIFELIGRYAFVKSVVICTSILKKNTDKTYLDYK